MVLMFGKLLPIIVIVLIGMLLQKVKEITPEVIAGLKFILINVGLPCVLFLSFVRTEFEYKYIFLFIIVFFMCCVLHGAGLLFKRWLPYKFIPWFFSGYEFGLVGIALFTAIWGKENLPLVTLIGLGHEIFIWFVYAPMLEYANSRKLSLKHIAKSFITSPIIIGILLGIGFNLTGLIEVIDQTIIGQSVLSTIDTLSLITVPLILLVVGYSLTFDDVKWKQSFYYIVMRLALSLTVGSLAYFLIITIIGNMDPMFTKLFFGLLLLPPPYLLPLLITKDENEIKFFSNIVLIYTFITFIGFIILVLI